jgi:hypothetical protein
MALAQAARCSGVSSRITPPESRIFWRLSMSRLLASALPFAVSSFRMVENCSRTSSGREFQNSTEVTSR